MSISITISNFSKSEFRGFSPDGGEWYITYGMNFLQGLNKTPSETIDAFSGHTEMVAEQNVGASVGADLFGFGLIYTNENNSIFGAGCFQNVQVLGMGPRPSWKVFTIDDSTSQGSWKDQDPSVQYTWEYSDVKIVATPNSSHSALSVEIVITDNK